MERPREYRIEETGFIVRDTPYGIARPIHFEGLQMVADHTIFEQRRAENRERVASGNFAMKVNRRERPGNLQNVYDQVAASNRGRVGSNGMPRGYSKEHRQEWNRVNGIREAARTVSKRRKTA